MTHFRSVVRSINPGSGDGRTITGDLERTYVIGDSAAADGRFLCANHSLKLPRQVIVFKPQWEEDWHHRLRFCSATTTDGARASDRGEGIEL